MEIDGIEQKYLDNDDAADQVHGGDTPCSALDSSGTGLWGSDWTLIKKVFIGGSGSLPAVIYFTLFNN